ncbi:hypothetical protein GGX14DRAFT_672331 [Mycena pura]|uniref:Uncharacterized protein n=1 Tax=Mycena pura TaxID=153505 RepID=A0AAD6UYP0_9AGAR|nr:hypothetical protein GGX14DRAFT_672331 [Mycena pura]
MVGDGDNGQMSAPRLCSVLLCLFLDLACVFALSPASPGFTVWYFACFVLAQLAAFKLLPSGGRVSRWAEEKGDGKSDDGSALASSAAVLRHSHESPLYATPGLITPQWHRSAPQHNSSCDEARNISLLRFLVIPSTLYTRPRRLPHCEFPTCPAFQLEQMLLLLPAF